jgi:hypothetical protein
VDRSDREYYEGLCGGTWRCFIEENGETVIVALEERDSLDSEQKELVLYT